MTATAEKGKVGAKKVVEVIDATCDSAHCFKARLLDGPPKRG